MFKKHWFLKIVKKMDIFRPWGINFRFWTIFIEKNALNLVYKCFFSLASAIKCHKVFRIFIEPKLMFLGKNIQKNWNCGLDSKYKKIKSESSISYFVDGKRLVMEPNRLCNYVLIILIMIWSKIYCRNIAPSFFKIPTYLLGI